MEPKKINRYLIPIKLETKINMSEKAKQSMRRESWFSKEFLGTMLELPVVNLPPIEERTLLVYACLQKRYNHVLMTSFLRLHNMHIMLLWPVETFDWNVSHLALPLSHQANHVWCI